MLYTNLLQIFCMFRLYQKGMLKAITALNDICQQDLQA